MQRQANELTRRQLFQLFGLVAAGTVFPFALQGCAGARAGASEVADAGAPARLTGFFFDTVVNIEAYCAQDVLDRVEGRLQRFENLFSRTKTGSDIYAVNHADGMPVEVQPETADLLRQALRYSELSGGLFDVTIGAVAELWDFKNQVVPAAADVERALAHVDWRTVGIDGTTVTLTDPEARIDVGGIAKGYIADDVAAFLRANGCTSALVNLGGNTFAVGAKPDGSPWDVGLQDPNQPRGALFATTRAVDASIVASGVNERSFVQGGMRYHHLLDPRTGHPMRNGTASATIVSASSLAGDALSTICFLLGARDGLAFAEQQGTQALFVADDGSVTKSDGLEVEPA